jgi:hypothetical protein
MPQLITVLLGAILASFFIPRIQAHYAAARTFAERRINLAGDTAVYFQRYIVSWRRLMQFAAQPKMTDDDKTRTLELADVRNDRRDKLLETLCLARMHFSSSTAALIDRFIEWDEAQSIKTLDELPKLGEWQEWSKRIASRLNKETKPRKRAVLPWFWRSLLPRSRRRKRSRNVSEATAAESSAS